MFCICNISCLSEIQLPVFYLAILSLKLSVRDFSHRNKDDLDGRADELKFSTCVGFPNVLYFPMTSLGGRPKVLNPQFTSIDQAKVLHIVTK